MLSTLPSEGPPLRRDNISEPTNIYNEFNYKLI